MLAAKSVAYSSGPSGLYLADLFKKVRAREYGEEPAKKQKQPYAKWTELADNMSKEASKFAEFTAKDGTSQQTAKAALQEIELDYQLGNLDEADYRSLKERYTRRAILAMKSRQNHEQELDELIEAQLRRMKEGNVAEDHDEE